MSSKKKVKACLTLIGVDGPEFFEGVAGYLDAEFARLKRAYFKKVLKAHPDKGGDPAVFRDVQSSWEVIRDMYEKKSVQTFATKAVGDATASSYDTVFSGFEDMPTQPYEYYEVRAYQYCGQRFYFIFNCRGGAVSARRWVFPCHARLRDLSGLNPSLLGGGRGTGSALPRGTGQIRQERVQSHRQVQEVRGYRRRPALDRQGARVSGLPTPRNLLSPPKMP